MSEQSFTLHSLLEVCAQAAPDTPAEDFFKSLNIRPERLYLIAAGEDGTIPELIGARED